ncbi:hypothetical protein ACFX11_024948 [Malus domestica]
MDPFIGVAKLRPHQSKPIYPFLSRKLKIKPLVESQLPSSLRITISNSKTLLVFAFGDGKLIHAIHNIAATSYIEALGPKFDDLTLTAPGAILVLGALSYFWAALGLTSWLFDLFVAAFIERLFRPTYKMLWVCRIFCFGEEGVDNAKYIISKWKIENANYKQSRETRKKVYTC